MGMTDGETIAFSQCWELSKRWYPGRDRIDWQPRTTAEMQEIFDAVRLRGAFWRLGAPQG